MTDASFIITIIIIIKLYSNHEADQAGLPNVLEARWMPLSNDWTAEGGRGTSSCGASFICPDRCWGTLLGRGSRGMSEG